MLTALYKCYFFDNSFYQQVLYFSTKLPNLKLFSDVYEPIYKTTVQRKQNTLLMSSAKKKNNSTFYNATTSSSSTYGVGVNCRNSDVSPGQKIVVQPGRKRGEKNQSTPERQVKGSISNRIMPQFQPNNSNSVNLHGIKTSRWGCSNPLPEHQLFNNKGINFGVQTCINGTTYINNSNISIPARFNNNPSHCSTVSSKLSVNYFRRGEPTETTYNKYEGGQSNTKKEHGSVLNREWKHVKGLHENKGFYFNIMSYNVLAQDLLDMHPYLYKHHDHQALPWTVRWSNLLKEIKKQNPDIMCFQEVQESHISDYFNILENILGYKSVYKRRTGARTDGCAIYYKPSSVTLTEYSMVEFYHPQVSVLDRDNVAIVVKFTPKSNSTKPFIVGTTHLLYNPKRNDIRLAQMQKFLSEIDKMAFKCYNKNGLPSYFPVILTGDLNLTPDCAVYEFITNSVLRYEYLTQRTLQKNETRPKMGKVLIPSSLNVTDNCQYAAVVESRLKSNNFCQEGDLKENTKNDQSPDDIIMPFGSGILTHEFIFKSVYNHVEKNDFEGTTFQDQWLTVDYIFYSGKKLKNKKIDGNLSLLAKYTLPTSNQLKNVKIPNYHLGSDHLCLIAKFCLD